MNEAQLFTIFLAIFITGILGFYAGRTWNNDDNNNMLFLVLLVLLITSGTVAGINLISLVANNF